MPKFTPKQKPRSVVHGLSLYPSQVSKLEYLAKHTGMSRSALVQQMIEHAYTNFRADDWEKPA